VQKKAQFPDSTTQNSRTKPNRIPRKPETHHNSPQKPNKCFIHKKVVGPLLLTFASPESPAVAFLVVILEGDLLLPVLLSSLRARP
jgi:hypothetical protein